MKKDNRNLFLQILNMGYMASFVILAFMITLVYWFHPLVWISYFCMVRDMEMSCDEYVLAKMGTKIRRDYSTNRGVMVIACVILPFVP